ncbi:hypothetical protein FACS1894158_18520 [Betaproteobacteria bacterium]|nr:hypothetical protein FACS1894158_18520 [Betaproteobacteria bacterium]
MVERTAKNALLERLGYPPVHQLPNFIVMKKQTALKTAHSEITPPLEGLFAECAALIEQGRQQIAARANSAMTLIYWQIGERINLEVLRRQRADYGKRVIATLSQKLVMAYGRGFEQRNLRRMMQFSKEFPNPEIVATLSTQLSWSHIIELLPVKTEQARFLYL